MYEVPSPYATRYAFSRFDGDELRGPLPAGALEDQVDVGSSPAVSEATQLLYLAERQAERLLSEARREARVHQKKPGPSPSSSGTRSSRASAAEVRPTSSKKRGHGARSLSVDHRDAAAVLFTFAAGENMMASQGRGRAADGRRTTRTFTDPGVVPFRHHF